MEENIDIKYTILSENMFLSNSFYNYWIKFYSTYGDTISKIIIFLYYHISAYNIRNKLWFSESSFSLRQKCHLFIYLKKVTFYKFIHKNFIYYQ